MSETLPNQPNTEKDLISQITRYIPLVTVLSLIFGGLSLATFYSNYGINIISYLELNEIIYRTIKDFVLITTFGIIYALSAYSISLTSFGNTYKSICSNKSFLTAIWINKPFFAIIILLTCATILLSVIYYQSQDKNDLTITYLGSTLLPLVMIITFIELNRRFYLLTDSFPSTETVSIVLFSIIIIFMSIITSDVKHKSLKNKNAYLKNSIIIDGKLITSTPVYYFIGKTNNYVFFFNEKDSIADIFPIGTIQKMTLREK